MSTEQLALFGGGRPVRRSARQTDRAIGALRKTRGLEPVDVGHVAMLRTVAELIDREVGDPEGSAFTAARLVAEWRALWAELNDRRDAGLDEEFERFFGDGTLAGVDVGAAPVRDPA